MTTPVIAAGIGGARLRILDGTRHLSLVERPEVWTDITTFLDRVSPYVGRHDG